MANTYDLQKLGETLQKSGLAINERVHDNISTMDYHEIQELSNRAQDLLIKSKTVYELANIQIGTDAQKSLDELNKAQGDITNVIKTVKLVQTAIDITAKLVTLAGAVISGNIGGILSSSNDVLTSVAEAVD